MSGNLNASQTLYEPPNIRGSDRRVFVLVAMQLVGITVCFIWALAPLAAPQSNIQAEAAESAAIAMHESQVKRLDQACFDAPIWLAAPIPPPPPAPSKPPAAPPPPAPLKWQLIAIERDGTTYRAILYDPQASQMIAGKEGDRLGTRQITKVTATTIEIRDGTFVRTLALTEMHAGEHP